MFFVFLGLLYGQPKLGFTGTDTVQAQEIDSFEILETVTKPASVKHIKEAKFTSTVIDDDAYLWPKHDARVSNSVLEEEQNAITSHFCKVDPLLTQDDLYYHPAGTKQFYGDDSLVSNAERYKAKIFIDTRYNVQHWTGFYAPPGELITVEIPDKALNCIKVDINVITTSRSYNYRRADQTSCRTDYINTTITKFGWPYGGAIDFFIPIDSFPEGLEVNISGVIKMPYFRYGATTEEEWNDKISKYPAPLAVFDTGSLHITGPSTFVRQKKNLNDVMAIWRTTMQIFIHQLQEMMEELKIQSTVSSMII